MSQDTDWEEVEVDGGGKVVVVTRRPRTGAAPKRSVDPPHDLSFDSDEDLGIYVIGHGRVKLDPLAPDLDKKL